MEVINAHSRSDDPVARALSNLAPHPFALNDVKCGSMEGFLQSLKFEDPELQREVALLVGFPAFKFGNAYGNGWKKEQTLWWRGFAMEREGVTYQKLLTSAYDALLAQSTDFQQALLDSVGKRLDHTMGKNDPTDTVLTRSEYVGQLHRVRFKLLQQLRSS